MNSASSDKFPSWSPATAPHKLRRGPHARAFWRGLLTAGFGVGTLMSCDGGCGDPCPDCDYETETAFKCVCFDLVTQETFDGDDVCAATADDAITSACTQGACPGAVAVDALWLDCGAPSDAGGDICSEWDPDSNVRYASGSYYINRGFLDDVVRDHTALMDCDGVTVSWGGSGPTVTGLNSGDLLYELGLRNGDVLLEVNNQDIDDVADAEAVLTAYLGGETEFEVTVQRFVGIATLQIETF